MPKPKSQPKFNPDYCIAPGATLQDWIEENHLTVRSTATTCGLHPDTLAEIISGEHRITDRIAWRLQMGTGIPASLWLKLEHLYRHALAEGKKDMT